MNKIEMSICKKIGIHEKMKIWKWENYINYMSAKI